MCTEHDQLVYMQASHAMQWPWLVGCAVQGSYGMHAGCWELKQHKQGNVLVLRLLQQLHFCQLEEGLLVAHTWSNTGSVFPSKEQLHGTCCKCHACMSPSQYRGAREPQCHIICTLECCLGKARYATLTLIAKPCIGPPHQATSRHGLRAASETPEIHQRCLVARMEPQRHRPSGKSLRVQMRAAHQEMRAGMTSLGLLQMPRGRRWQAPWCVAGAGAAAWSWPACGPTANACRLASPVLGLWRCLSCLHHPLPPFAGRCAWEDGRLGA